MLDSIKEFFVTISILMVIFPPFGIIVFIAIIVVIEHIFGFEGGGNGGQGEGPEYRGEEAMRFLKSADPKGYKRFTDKYPDEKID